MTHSRDPRLNPGIKRAYLELPSSLTGEQSFCVTIPGGLDNKKRLIDLLTIATRWYSWERSAGTEGKEAADKWRDVMNLPELNMCCCPEPTNRRYNEEGDLEVSYDGGITWVLAPELDDRFSGIVAPPMPGEDGENKRCIAAASAEEYVKLNLIEELTEGSSYAELNAALVAIVAALGVTGVGLLIAAAAAAIFIAGVGAVTAAFTTEVWTTFRCILFCRIRSDGSFDEAGWEAVKADILDQFTGVVSAILYNWVNSVGVVGLTNSARSGFVASADCSGCTDCPSCTAESQIQIGDFVSRTETEIVIDAVLTTYNSIFAYWVVYGDWETGTCCLICDTTYDPGISSAGWSDCDGVSHDGTSPNGELVGQLRAYSTAGAFTQTIRIFGDESCP